MYLNHLHRNTQEAAQNLPEQDLECRLQRIWSRKMGGTITFESEEGAGTTFVIRVPFKIDMNADKREKQKDVSEKSIKGLHILLAEDNELNMEIAEFMLQNEGTVVTKAWNGQEAVELFRKK